MRFKKSKEEEPILGITPLIDIVFLLLIFFMLTSHFHVASGVPIRLPKVSQKAHDQKSIEVMLSIDKDGNTHINGEKTALNELKLKLMDIIEKKKISKIILQADEETKHGKVVAVMDLAKSAGISTIVIAAQWNPEKVI